MSRRWLVGLVALVGIANFVGLLAQTPRLAHSLYLNADNASALVLPALASHAPPGSIVSLGDHPWYEPWWFMRATVGLGGHRQLWEAAPILVALLGIAAVTACAWCALGRLAGLLSGVALLAVSESLRGVLYVPESHGLIVLHVGVLCGALLIVHRRVFDGGLTPRLLLLVGVPLVVFTGAGLTDQLLFVSALGPFILAPLTCWLRLRSRAWRTVSLFALGTSVLSALLALLLTHLMQAQHVIHAPFPVDFVGSEAMLVALQNLIAAFVSPGGGAFFGGPSVATICSRSSPACSYCWHSSEYSARCGGGVARWNAPPTRSRHRQDRVNCSLPTGVLSWCLCLRPSLLPPFRETRPTIVTWWVPGWLWRHCSESCPPRRRRGR